MALLATTAPAHASGPAPGSPVRTNPVPTQGGGFSFADLLDAVNPLQHIPVVSTLYRAVTGDEIKTPARLLGGGLFGFGLFGGLAGLASAAANSLLAGATGKDAGAHVLALLRGKEEMRPATPSIALATTEPAKTKPANMPTPVTPLLDMAADRALAQSVGGARPLLFLDPPARARERERTEPTPPSAFSPAAATPAQAERAYGQALAAMQAALDRHEERGRRLPERRE